MSRGERQISGPIQRLLDRIAPSDPFSRISAVWPKAVGESIAREASPTSLRGGVLTVACRSGVWAQELTLMSRSLTGKLNDALEEELITEIRCVISDSSHPG